MSKFDIQIQFKHKQQQKRVQMIETTVPLIKLQDTNKNQNAQYGINAAVQMSMANGNAQFAIDLARHMKISYSIPTIALQIASRFFHVKCYINYDRFMVILASIVLAFKLKYMEFRVSDLVYSFYTVMSFRCHTNQPYDENKLKKIKNEICIAESEILRTFQYDINVVTPHDFVNKIFSISFPGEVVRNSKDNKIITTTRILILDSNRSQCSLYFTPLVICVSSFLIACRYEATKPYGLIQNKSTDTSGVQKSEEDLYGEWLDTIGRSENEKIKQQDVLECIKQMNQIFKLIAQ